MSTVYSSRMSLRFRIPLPPSYLVLIQKLLIALYVFLVTGYYFVIFFIWSGTNFEGVWFEEQVCIMNYSMNVGGILE